jgi:hypothetical protein
MFNNLLWVDRKSRRFDPCRIVLVEQSLHSICDEGGKNQFLSGSRFEAER